MLNDDPAIREVRNFKGEIIGPGKLRFKADIEFDGREIAKKYLHTRYPAGVQKVLDEVKTAPQMEVLCGQFANSYTNLYLLLSLFPLPLPVPLFSCALCCYTTTLLNLCVFVSSLHIQNNKRSFW